MEELLLVLKKETGFNNWFESNPTKSVIGHSLLVAAATWAAFYFVFDENKINIVKAEAAKYRAETKEVQARNTVLIEQRDQLRQENDKYLKWLSEEPKTLPFYENKIAKLEAEVLELKTQLEESSTKTDDKNKIPPSVNDKFYSIEETLKVGSTFIDKKTNVVIGVQNIEIDRTAGVYITYPSGNTFRSDSVVPGEAWSFTVDGIKYSLVLSTLDWPAQKYTVTLFELKK